MPQVTPLDLDVVVPSNEHTKEYLTEEGFSSLNEILADLVESVYGSKLEMALSGGELKGLYTPPSPTGGGAADERPGPGKATLAGKIRQEDGRLVFDGQWEHTDGPLSQGRFMMVQKQNPSQEEIRAPVFEGWWREGVEDDDDDVDSEIAPDSPHQSKWKTWAWGLEKASTCDTDSVGRDFTIDDSEASLSLCSDEVAATCWRAKVNQMIQSAHMERFTMACVWLFFVQTVIQLVAAHLELEAELLLNCLFNAIYSTLYAMFLCVYAVMVHRPARLYMVGVLLYFFGYVAFLIIYASLLAVEDYHVAWYHLGSWLFVVGSALLVKATIPVKEEHVTFTHRFSPLRLENSCFWGSLCFLVGSVVFAASAAELCDGVSGGLAIFVAGRFCFVCGSRTERCNFLLLREGAAKNSIVLLKSRSAEFIRSRSATFCLNSPRSIGVSHPHATSFFDA